MKKIAVFASGTGSNALNIIEYFEKGNTAKVELLVSNKPQAPVLKKAFHKHVATHIIPSKEQFYTTQETLSLLREKEIDLIVLAGFLWLIPSYLTQAYPDKIINIHPSLLPKYGGKGMYGSFVHQAVLENGEAFSGITIHYVNEKYDEGQIIFQEKLKINSGETVESLSKRIHQLEHKNYPRVLENLMFKLC